MRGEIDCGEVLLIDLKTCVVIGYFIYSLEIPKSARQRHCHQAAHWSEVKWRGLGQSPGEK